MSPVPYRVRGPRYTEELEQTQTCPVAPQTGLPYLEEQMTHGGYTGKPRPARGPLFRAAPPTWDTCQSLDGLASCMRSGPADAFPLAPAALMSGQL